MSLFFNQIFTLLTTPPGNLVYHIVLVFSIAGALQGAIQFLRSSQFPQARRMVLGLGILLGLQVFLFIVSGLAWQGLLDSKAVLPPLDRAVTHRAGEQLFPRIGRGLVTQTAIDNCPTVAVLQQPEIDVIELEGQPHADPMHAGRNFNCLAEFRPRRKGIIEVAARAGKSCSFRQFRNLS